MRRAVARLLPALAGALAFVIVLAAFSVADPGPSAPQPAPATLAMPVAKAGDRALYSQEVTGSSSRMPSPNHVVAHGPAPWMAFEMLDVGAREVDGREHRTYTARVTRYDMATLDGTPLSTATVTVDGGHPGDPMPAPSRRAGPAGQDGKDGADVVTGGGPPASAWDCMLWSLANGRVADLSQPVVLYQDCDVSTAGSLDGGTSIQGSGGLDSRHGFRALGLDTVGGIPAVVLRYDWAGSYAIVWMSEAVPYPLLMVDGEKAPPAGDGPQMVVYRLAMFEPGDGVPRPIPADDLPRVDAASVFPLPTAPRTPWLLDETGTTMAFPASEAWRVAVADPEVGAWLAEHPKAAAVRARASHDVSTPAGWAPERFGWTFDADDGSAALSFRVVRSIRTLPGPVPTALPPEHQVQVTGTIEPVGVPLPDRLPTLAGLEALWRERVQPDAGNATFDHWSFRVTHRTPVATWEAEAGHELHVSAPYPLSGSRQDRSVLHVGDSGRTLAAKTAGGSPGAGDGSAAPPFDTAGADLASAAIDESVWRKPVAFAAAGGAGLLAAAVTAWLTWKPSVVGLALFSRIREERLLEHPLRRRIADAVAAQPGIHAADLVRRVAAPRGSVMHHVAKLVAAGHLVEAQVGKYACYRLPSAKASAAPGSMHVLEALRARPGVSAAELARTLGLAPATVHHHLQKLRAAGLLDAHAGPGLRPAGGRAASAPAPAA